MNYLLDENNDIVVGKRIARVSGARHVAQLVKCRLDTFLGEWIIDPSVGIPWDVVLVRGYDLEVVYHAVHRKIATTRGVNKINSFSMVPDKKQRKLLIQFEAETNYGVITEIIKI